MNVINADKNADKPFYLSMLIKLNFSCLIDADRLDASWAENDEMYSSELPEGEDLLSNLEKKISELQAKENTAMSVLRKKYRMIVKRRVYAI